MQTDDMDTTIEVRSGWLLLLSEGKGTPSCLQLLFSRAYRLPVATWSDLGCILLNISLHLWLHLHSGHLYMEVPQHFKLKMPKIEIIIFPSEPPPSSLFSLPVNEISIDTITCIHICAHTHTHTPPMLHRRQSKCHRNSFCPL